MLHSPLFTQALLSPAPACPHSAERSRTAVNEGVCDRLMSFGMGQDSSATKPGPLLSWPGPFHKSQRDWEVSGVSKKGESGDKRSILVHAAKVWEIVWPSSVDMRVIPQIVAPRFATL